MKSAMLIGPSGLVMRWNDLTEARTTTGLESGLIYATLAGEDGTVEKVVAGAAFAIIITEPKEGA